MRKFYLVLGFILFSSFLAAQNCDIDGFVTFTQGGWGNKASGNNPGSIRDANFDQVFPNGLIIQGTVNTLTFTSAAAIQAYLPAGGPSSIMTSSLTDPTNSKIVGNWGGQIVALKLNIEFDKAGVIGSNNRDLQNLVIDDQNSPFFGMTVSQFIQLAEQALTGGGNNGYSYSDIGGAADAINNNFDNGTQNNGYLTCPLDTPQPITDWEGGFYASDSAICLYDAQEITVEGWVDLSPELTVARVQTTWRIVHPQDNPYGTATHYASIWVTGDDTFSITGMWPGIKTGDEKVEIHFGANVLNANGNPIHNGIGLDYYWYPWVCDPPQAQTVDLEVLKVVNNTNPEDGETVTYTVSVLNNGPGDATGVVLTDLIPESLTITNFETASGTYDPVTGLWEIGAIPNGQTVQINVSVQVSYSNFNTTIIDLGIASDYNLFVGKDITQPTSDTEGKIAAGRDISLSNYSVGDKLPGYSGDVLIAGKNLEFISGRVFNGNAVYSKTTNLPQPLVTVDGELRKDEPVNFSEAMSYLKNVSQTLKGMQANMPTVFDNGLLLLNGSDAQKNIFLVEGTDLSNANNVVINVPNGAVVVVNIKGDNVSWSGGLTIGGTSIQNVIYNFYQAKDLHISGIDVTGAILAPKADCQFPSGVVNGQAIFKNLTGSGQFNNVKFVGNVPLNEFITNTAEITNVDQTDSDESNNLSSVSITLNETVANGNNNWTILPSHTGGAPVYSMAVGNDDAIYTGTSDGRIYKSIDGGSSWVIVNDGMPAAYIWSLEFNNSGILFAGTEQGVFEFVNNSTWERTSLQNLDVRTLHNNGGILYAGTWNNGVFKSEDGGVNWSEMNNNIPNLVITSIKSLSNGDIVAGTYGAGVIKYSGDTWLSTGLNYPLVWDVAVTSNDYIYAATYGDGLHYMKDGAWTKANFVAYYIYSVDVDIDDNIYACSYSTGIFLSSTYGDSWIPVGLSGAGLNTLLIDNSHSESINYVYAAAADGNLYRADASITSVNAENGMPIEFSLFQNYPNPFNPTTTIKFSIPEDETITLKIFNILGQEVSTLLNKNMKSGLHEVEFDASSLSSGIYFYSLTAGKYAETKKLLLLK